MHVTQGKQSVILKDEYDNLQKFASFLEGRIPKKYANQNIIIDLLPYTDLDLEGLLLFLPLSDTHRAAAHSMVIINASIDYDSIPDELMVVPTLQEAEDIVEMEEIERDLGF